MFENFVKPGKINMVIDGAFGSTGKGAVAARIAMDTDIIHLACSTTSPNAGHTFYWNNTKYITHLIPAAAIIHDRCGIYMSADSVIDYDLLMKEMDEFNIDDGRLFIHPRACVITDEDKEIEARHGGIETIASTQSGVGSARARKILRTGLLAENDPRLKDYVKKYDIRRDFGEIEDCKVLVETGQGLGLDINHGYSYPYCTSRSVLPAKVLEELALHPKYCGNIMLCFRTFPIRVGNPTRDGKEVGFSGPFWDDSVETSFEEIGVDKELTTVTKRVRRVATFSVKQYEDAIYTIEPTHVIITFMNYLEEMEDFPILKRAPDYINVGPYPDDICAFPGWCNEIPIVMTNKRFQKRLAVLQEWIDEAYAINSAVLTKTMTITDDGYTELKELLRMLIQRKSDLNYMYRHTNK